MRDSNTIRICSLNSTNFEDATINSNLTQNGRSITEALADVQMKGGTLPFNFALLAASLTPEELAASPDQLSGEVSTVIAPMGSVSRRGHWIVAATCLFALTSV